jgi:hypothetical protein
MGYKLRFHDCPPLGFTARGLHPRHYTNPQHIVGSELVPNPQSEAGHSSAQPGGQLDFFTGKLARFRAPPASRGETGATVAVPAFIFLDSRRATSSEYLSRRYLQAKMRS